LFNVERRHADAAWVFGIRRRLIAWVMIIALPLLITALVTSSVIERRLLEDAERSQLDMARLEAERISWVLVDLRERADSLASVPVLVGALDPGNPEVSSTDPMTVEGVLDEAISVAPQLDLAGVTVLDRPGRVLSRSGVEGDAVVPETLAGEAMDRRSTLVGNALPDGSGWGLLEVAAPIIASDGAVVGALHLVVGLDSVVEPLARYEASGDTTEANLVQRRDGRLEVITLRRFDRSSAFSDVDGAPGSALATQSLEATGVEVAHAGDYRGIRTIAGVAAIDGAGWGLTVKVDEDEAVRLFILVQRIILVAAVVTSSVLFLAWLLELRPLGRRLDRVAAAAERVAGGEYQDVLGDRRSDEIARVSGSIDRLAADLLSGQRDRLEVEAELDRERRIDPVTGLATRSEALSFLRAGHLAARGYALTFLDLDQFRDINAAYGDEAGDEVLAIVGRRIAGLLGPDDLAARWGSDEFLVVVPDAGLDEIEALAEGIAGAVTEPVTLATGVHRLGATHASAISRGDRSAGDVLTDARNGVRIAKRGRGDQRTADPASIELVERALASSRVEVHYQPVVAAPTETQVEVRSVEALVRIRGTDGELVPPGRFVPGLGASEVGRALDLRVIELAMADLASWRRRGIVDDDFRIAFNLGPGLIERPGIVEHLTELLARHGLDGRNVVAEIPETVGEVADELVSGLASLGMALAIDDVGCQFSNIERMVDLPAEIAKIDRRWTMDLDIDDKDGIQVLKSLVHVCHLLGFDVIAEGVETAGQADILRQLGVTRFQGFHFAKPMPVRELEDRLASEGRGDITQTTDRSASHEPSIS